MRISDWSSDVCSSDLPDDENLSALLELFTDLYREPIIVQRYLPEVRSGDKRIILIDGRPAGAINRVPAKGEARSNMHAGGRPAKSQLKRRENEIRQALSAALTERWLSSESTREGVGQSGTDR